MQDNNVWIFFNLRDNFMPIGCKWVSRSKGIQEVMLNDLKLGWLLNGSLNMKGLTNTFSMVSNEDSFRISWH